MEAASELDITLIASASLLQGQVAKNLPEFVAEALGLGTTRSRAAIRAVIAGLRPRFRHVSAEHVKATPGW